MPPQTLFDVELYPEGLSQGDLDDLVHFGLTHALALARWDPEPRDEGGLARGMEGLLEGQLGRLERAGLSGFAALGLPPRPPRRGLERALHRLAAAFTDRRALAVGPLEAGESPLAAHLFERQLEVARDVGRPVIVRLPTGPKRPLEPLFETLLRLRVDEARLLFLAPRRAPFRTLRELGRFQALRVGPR
ncbi:MAG: hypothetical protein ACYCWW_15130, partial [Deltaproteobacteria bacterium]